MRYIVLVLLLGLPLDLLFADSRPMRGAVVILEREGAVSVREVETGSLPDLENSPLYLNGLVMLEVEARSSVAMATSSGIFMELLGSGKLEVERLEELLAENVSGTVSELNQMLLTIREGQLLMDSRKIPASGAVMIETPLGRISSGPAMWSLKLNYNKNIRGYSLELECIEGALRYTNLQGQLYELTSGRRVIGSQNGDTIASEVNYLNLLKRDEVKNFIRKTENASELYDVNTLLTKMQTIDFVQAKAFPLTERFSRDREPYIILQLVPRPETTFPFRGKVAPPSSKQTDLF